MKKILSIFAVILCLAACSESTLQMDYSEILDKEGLCNQFEGIEAIVLRTDCVQDDTGCVRFCSKTCKTVIDTTICKDGTKISK